MALPTKTAAEIITLFELQVDDVTELSSTEELSILNRVYQRVCAKKPWVFLMKTASGSLSTDATSTYITKPTDFFYFLENYQYTDTNLTNTPTTAPKVIYLGSNYNPVNIINFQDRRMYRNQSNYAYLSPSEGKIRFTYTPSETTYEFDYCKIPDDLTISDSPIFPASFHEMLAYGMAVEKDILELSDKAKSYATENQARFENDILQMEYWHAQQFMN